MQPSSDFFHRESRPVQPRLLVMPHFTATNDKKVDQQLTFLLAGGGA